MANSLMDRDDPDTGDLSHTCSRPNPDDGNSIPAITGVPARRAVGGMRNSTPTVEKTAKRSLLASYFIGGAYGGIHCPEQAHGDLPGCCDSRRSGKPLGRRADLLGNQAVGRSVPGTTRRVPPGLGCARGHAGVPTLPPSMSVRLNTNARIAAISLGSPTAKLSTIRRARAGHALGADDEYVKAYNDALLRSEWNGSS